jgi:hypothetical protein
VSEDEIEVCDDVFPVQHLVTNLLFIRSDEIGGYLPKPKLSDTFKMQWAGCHQIWESESSAATDAVPA